jgi:pimeloyl-ACP methyl ester carboxylesterase
MGENPRPIVLVPGACLGGWAWKEVAARLRAGGHDVYPVTLTGLGDRAHLATREIDVETHVTDVMNVLDYEGLEDAVLVGHSYSGVVVGAVAAERPERLNASVYLDTGPLPDGMAISDVQPPELRDRQRLDAEQGGDGWLWPVPDRATLESGIFGSAAGLRDEHFRWLRERGTPQPYATLTSPVRTKRDITGVVRRVEIFCSAGGGMSVEAVRGLIAEGDPRAEIFAAPDWELHEIETGHWAMWSAPEELAGLLHDIATG